MKKISILGSTGSIGTQTLNVLRNNKDSFEITALSANRNIELLMKQVKEFSPEFVCVYDEKSADEFEKMLEKEKIHNLKFSRGMDGLIKAATYEGTQLLVTAVVGMVGLVPTLKAVEHKIDIALANKETLVTAGDLVISAAKKNGVKILPVDSEHSAIFQCLVGEKEDRVKNIILTASGGAFRDMSIEEISTKKAVDALKHPNWSMGEKITVDSATMMNKGFEIIEAYHLFNTGKIKVYIHRQSLVHSMVEFCDNSIKMQVALPDMRGAISYALNYPERKAPAMDELDLSGKNLTFEDVRYNAFPCMSLAKEALKQGGTSTSVLNAANEELVYLYLNDKIGFYDISDTIRLALEKHNFIKKPNLDEILQADKWAREFVKKHLSFL